MSSFLWNRGLIYCVPQREKLKGTCVYAGVKWRLLGSPVWPLGPRAGVCDQSDEHICSVWIAWKSCLVLSYSDSVVGSRSEGPQKHLSSTPVLLAMPSFLPEESNGVLPLYCICALAINSLIHFLLTWIFCSVNRGQKWRDEWWKGKAGRAAPSFFPSIFLDCLMFCLWL